MVELARKKAIVRRMYRHKIIATGQIIDLMDDERFVSELEGIGDELFKDRFKEILESFSNPHEDVGRKIDIVFSYDPDIKGKRSFADFVTFFNNRYKAIQSMLMKRQDLKNAISVARARDKTERETVAFVGYITEKRLTKNENYILDVEDPTGTVKVIVSKDKKEVFEVAQDTVTDEVVGVVGSAGNKVVFANKIITPDVPVINEFKKGVVEEYFVVLSDVHVGSKYFLHDEFNNFLEWINGRFGTDEQKALAKKVKYVFVVGDLVDGVGIYPSQERELTIPDIYGQYAESARLLSKIPKHVKIIICPGNHDACRLAEPQPTIHKDIARDLYELPNVAMVSNPCVINIGKHEGFEGFNVLLYHGYSFDYYMNRVHSIKNSGRHISERSDLVMRFLLKRRHLAPAYGSTPYTPDVSQDSLVIYEIPDFFLSGHIHKSCIMNYRGVSLISGSCFQAKTSFQEKVGHDPDPAKVPLVNLKDRSITTLDFNNK